MSKASNQSTVQTLSMSLHIPSLCQKTKEDTLTMESQSKVQFHKCKWLDVKCNLKTSVFSCCLPHIHVGTGKVQEIKVPPQHMRRWINQRCMWVWAKSTVIIAPGRRQTNIKMKEKRYKFIQNKINITVELHLRGTALYINTNNQVSTRNVCVRTSRDNWLTG